jgi:DNA-binding transcriptional LysR family regulator
MKTNFTILPGDCDGLLIFLRVARRRGFSAAAADLGVSPSAVSQAIRRLEARIGTPLFVRTTRSVALTEAGRLLEREARPALAAVEAAWRQTREAGDQLSGLLRLNVPRVAAGPLLQRIVADFCREHPNVSVELHASDVLADIVAEGFDAGVRLAGRLAADMVAVRLTQPFRFEVVGHPDYFRRHGKPVRPADLAAHTCVNYRTSLDETAYAWEFERGGQRQRIAVTGPLIVNDWALALQAASLGLGLAYVPGPLLTEEVARARMLERVLERYGRKTDGAFLYYPRQKRTDPRVRALVRFIRSRVS